MADVSKPLNQHSLPTSKFGFSAVPVEDLAEANSQYTLVCICVDTSSSVDSFKPLMENCIKEIVASCEKSDYADQLLVRVCVFNTDFSELHGYRPLADISPQDYDGVLHKYRGWTALYDAAENAARSIQTYSNRLYDQQLDVNGILVVLSDGLDNSSYKSPDDVRLALADSVQSEKLESLLSILVGVNLENYEASSALESFRDNAGMSQFIDVGEANSNNIAKLANFVSQSISSQSQALGTGEASKPLTWN